MEILQRFCDKDETVSNFKLAVPCILVFGSFAFMDFASLGNIRSWPVLLYDVFRSSSLLLGGAMSLIFSSTEFDYWS